MNEKELERYRQGYGIPHRGEENTMKKEIEEMEREIYLLNREIRDLTLDLEDCLQRQRRSERR
ncbi:MAG: hypothetical protein U9N61_00255 [Euryarchaeota archaeon]|nr:hypothetical protein [Euryarchaeota archaeon]